MGYFRIFAGFAGFLAVVALLGGMAFGGLSKTDLFNNNTSAAQARAIDVQTDLYGEKGSIDLEVYRNSVSVNTWVEIEKASIELAYQRQLNIIKLRREEANQILELDKQRALNRVRVEAERALYLGAVITFSLVILILNSGMIIAIIRIVNPPSPGKAN